MNFHVELLRHLPTSGIAGALVPIVQFAFQRLPALQAIHKKHRLRDEAVALNSFISSMNEAQDSDDSDAACLQDALRERGFVLRQLDSLIAAEARRTRRLVPTNTVQRLFLLYAPSRPIGWPLRWAFFTLLILTGAGIVRGLLGVNYLSLPVLVPFLIVTFVVTVLVRIAVFCIEGIKPGGRSRPDRLTRLLSKLRAGV
jgi:predicted nucleic acid-binding protein